MKPNRSGHLNPDVLALRGDAELRAHKILDFYSMCLNVYLIQQIKKHKASFKYSTGPNHLISVGFYCLSLKSV